MFFKTKNLFPFLLAFHCLFSPQIVQGSCFTILSRLGDNRQSAAVEVINDAEFKSFDAARARYISYFKNHTSDLASSDLPSEDAPQNIHEALGLMASLEAKGLSNNYDFNRFFQDVGRGEKSQQKALVKELKTLIKKEQVGFRQLNRIADLIYLMSNPSTSSFAQYDDIKIRSSDLMEQRFTREITTHTLLDALDDLGFVRDPAILEKIRRNKAIKEYLKPILMVTLMVPRMSLLDAKIMDAQTFDAIYAAYLEAGGNFEAIRPQLEKFYGFRSKYDFTWLWMRKVYTTLTLSVMITMTLTQGIPTAIHEGPQVVHDAPMVLDHVEKYTVPTLLSRVGLFHLSHKAEIQNILFNDWLTSRTFFTGKRPIPSDPAYQAAHQDIYGASDLELYFRSQK